MSGDPGSPRVGIEQPREPEPAHGEGVHLEHETIADVEAERTLLSRAIGGWRGVIDSGAPAALFVTVYLVSGSRLGLSLWVAIGAAVLIALWRLVRRESLQQVIAGLVGVGVSAFVASRTGQAEDFFLPGLLINIAYGSAFLISILVRWPLIGVVIGYLTGQGVRWRQDIPVRRAYAAATWIWVGVFGARLLVQLPLYFAGAVGALGVMRIIMGWPLFLAGAYVTYLVLRPTLRARREGTPAPGETRDAD